MSFWIEVKHLGLITLMIEKLIQFYARFVPLTQL